MLEGCALARSWHEISIGRSWHEIRHQQGRPDMTVLPDESWSIVINPIGLAAEAVFILGLLCLSFWLGSW
jgi:hypothetical protein